MSVYQHQHRLVRLSRRALAGLAGCVLICLSGNGVAGAAPCPDIVGNNLCVPNNCTYTISGCESYDNVTVKSGGTLLLGSGAVLKIKTTLTITSPGLFQFNQASGGGAVQPILRATSNLVISGDIDTVSTKDLGGKIEMDANQSVRLASGTISSLYGPIDITADFDNRGTVTANGGTNGFDITFTGAIAAGSSGLFQVTAANAEMIFNHSAAVTITSGADFCVTGGCMLFQEDMETDGGFKQTGGSVKAGAGVTFKATGAYP